MDEVTLTTKFSRAMSTLYEILIENRGYESINRILMDGEVPLPNHHEDDDHDTEKKDAEESVRGDSIPQVFPTVFLATSKKKKKSNPANNTLIFLCRAEKLNIDGVKEMIRLLDTYRIKRGILVYQNSITSSAKKTLDLLDSYDIELFAVHELQYNITKHMYYCKHEKVLDPQELGTLQNQTAKFPKILSSDPIVRFFGFHKNDILRIHRRDGTIVYRIVR
jgi:hypothetical protein